MSDTRHEDATLLGHAGPFFKGLEAVQALYLGQSVLMNVVFLELVCTKLDTETELGSGVETDDHYTWQHVLSFTEKEQRFVLLLPYALDVTKDTTCADRHVALYYRGPKVSQRRLTSIMLKLQNAFMKAYVSRYGKLP